MSEPLYIQGGKILTDGGAFRLCCCQSDPDDPDPPWVCPDCPDWPGPGGPQPPNNPDGNPRCCTGNTICTPTNNEPLYMGTRVTGSISVEYEYTTGPNAGVPLSYSQDWNEVFVEQTSGSACQVADQANINLTVPYVSVNGDPNNPADLPFDIQVTRIRWDRNRGFFGPSADSSTPGIFSGIRYAIDGIRGHVNAGYSMVWQFCRSEFPTLPINPASDTVDWVRQPFTNLETRILPPTLPTGVCLNRVIAEYTDAYTDSTGGGTTTVNVTLRLYTFVSGLTPCLTI